MNIVADRNIAFVAEAFEQFGDVSLETGRNIDAGRLACADILLTRSQTKVNAALLDNTPVKWVGSATSGVEHVDTQYLEQRGIGFADARGSNAVSVAEYVISVLAALCELRGCELQDFSVGIVGYGEIGTRLVERLELLEITCKVNDPLLEGRVARKFSPLAEVLRADVVTLHVPLTCGQDRPTAGLIGAAELELMRPHAVLINAARGGVVDEQALLVALERRPAMAAVIDCWRGEPAVNVELLERAWITTPHIAGHSYDGKVNGTRQIYAAACDYFAASPNWLSSLQADDVNEIKAPESLQRLLLDCYDIHRDNTEFKRCLKLSDSERAKQFDRLRGDYPKRREFSARRVDGEIEGISASTLNALGFKNYKAGEDTSNANATHDDPSRKPRKIT